ncbi:hypothetical protein HDE_09554 [Halotydeus destructor]|nr:hypothetical protein HDE_09554 [Halotydeus destructor]
MEVALLVIVLPVFMVQADRISDRFDFAHIKRTPVRIAVMGLDDAPPAVNAAIIGGLSTLLRKTNFTMQPISSLSVGYPTHSGKYSSFLGQLIDNKSDVAVAGTVLSSFRFPGLVPLQVESTLSLKVHSQVSPEIHEKSDVLSSIEQLPLEFKILLFVAVHIVAGCIIDNDIHNPLRYFESYAITMRCFVSQAEGNLKSNRKRVLWWHANVFAFIIVFGYVLNMMSTNTFVMKQPRRVQRFEDAFDPYFKNIKFYMLKNELFFNTMRDADENTIMGKLFRKLRETSDCSHMSTCSFLEIKGQLGSANHRESLQLVKNISEHGGGANFVTNEVVQAMVVLALCRTHPGLVGRLYTAPRALAEDILVNFVRDDLDRDVVIYLRHIFSAEFEFDHFWRSMQETLHKTLDALGIRDRDFKYLSCVLRRQPESDDVTIQSRLVVYKRIGSVFSYLMLGTGLVVLAELSVLRQVKRRRRSQPVRIVRHCVIRTSWFGWYCQ